MSTDERGEDVRRRRKLVEGVLGMVDAIALRLAKVVGIRWLEELRAAGHLGAAQAANAFDFEAGTPFDGFAWPRIFGAMVDFLRKERVRLPPEMQATIEKAAAVLGAAADYAAVVRDKGDDTTEEEASGMATAAGIGLLCLGGRMAVQDPERRLVAEEMKRLVHRGIAQLRERDRVIVNLRDFEGWKFRKIAEHFGIEEDAARKRYHDAVRRLGAVLRPILLAE
jgi:RNA polymerase sigma factor (sigma-70 family)